MDLDDTANFVDRNETAAENWRMSLVRKGRDTKELPDPNQLALQRSLLRAAFESSEALAHNLRQGLGIDEADLSGFPTLADPITAAELKNLQSNTALRLHSDMTASGCTRRYASTRTYWLLCIIHWLETGKLDDPPADAFIFRSIKAELLEDNFELTATNGPAHGEQIDDRTRDLLRGLGGITLNIRAHTSFWTDCPIAHQWWAVELSLAVAKTADTTFSREAALEFLLNRPIMEEILKWIARWTGRLAHPVALASVLEAAIGKDTISQANYTQLKSKEVRQMMERLARRSRHRQIDKESPVRLQDLVTYCHN